MTDLENRVTAVDVCLVVPPFESMHFPNLGTAILKSACLARGLSTRVVYGGMIMAAMAGLDLYDGVYESPMKLKVGERLFRSQAYPPEIALDLPDADSLSAGLAQLERDMAPFVEPALEAIVEQVMALRPKIVGLTSTFQQNLAASALARLIKQRSPETLIVLGGPNAAGPLAAGLADAFPWIDHFFSGEADIDFPDFCEAYLTANIRPATRVVTNAPINDMRTVFAPDYTDFFDQLRPLQASGALPANLPRYLLAESSRGCWWGAKNHCTFCGLNAEGMMFREKPVERVLSEIEELKQWGVPRLMLTDNIMPHHYLKDLLPRLADQPDRLGLYYEIKANLTEAQVDQLVQGGVVAIQPGIESLSSDTLRLMRKGVSSHQNIALLRHCGGVSLQVFWNILYGLPGECAADYEATIALIPSLHHLFPPRSAVRIVIDRYSPYFGDPEGMGVAPIKPQDAYRALYPAAIPVDTVAYHFVGDYHTEMLDRPDLITALDDAISDWRNSWADHNPPILQMFEREGGTVVLDTRPMARKPLTTLTEGQYAALTELARPKSRAALDADLIDHAQSLVELGFVIDHDDALMSIVVKPRADVAARRVALAGVE